MTDEKIFELAKTCEFVGLDDYRMLLCYDDELVKFARAIYSAGWEEGHDQGCYDAGGGQ